MDRLSKIKTSDHNSSGDSSLIDSSLNDAYQTADEGSSSSRYCSVIDDTVLDVPDITNTSHDIEVHDADKTDTEVKYFEEDIKCLSNSRTSDALDPNYNAANILSGEVNIFDENSVDEPDLVIDDTVLIEVEIGSPQNVEGTTESSPKSGSTFISTDNIKNNDKFIADEPSFERNSLISNISQLSKKSSLAQPLYPPKDSATSIEEKQVQSVLNEGQIGDSVDMSTTTNEVILQIDGKNVDAIDVGNGLYLYRKDGTEELTSVQIIQSETGEQQFKFLKVRQNEEGNLEVYEEQILEIPELQPLSLDQSTAETDDVTTIMDEKCELSPKTTKVHQKSKISDKIGDSTTCSPCTEQVSSVIPSKVFALTDDLILKCSKETKNVSVGDDIVTSESQLIKGCTKDTDRNSLLKYQGVVKQSIEDSNILLSMPSTSAIVISAEVNKNVPAEFDNSKITGNSNEGEVAICDAEIPKLYSLSDKLCSISSQSDMKVEKESKVFKDIKEDFLGKLGNAIPKPFGLPDKSNCMKSKSFHLKGVKDDSLDKFNTTISTLILNGDVETNHEPHTEFKKYEEKGGSKGSAREPNDTVSLSDSSSESRKQHGSKETNVINQNENKSNLVEEVFSKSAQDIHKFTSSLQNSTSTNNQLEIINKSENSDIDEMGSKIQVFHTILPLQISPAVPKIENTTFEVSDLSENPNTETDLLTKDEQVFKTSIEKQDDKKVTVSCTLNQDLLSIESDDIHNSNDITLKDTKELQSGVIYLSEKEDLEDIKPLNQPLTSIIDKKESNLLSSNENIEVHNSIIDVEKSLCISKKEILPVSNEDSQIESFDSNCLMDRSVPDIFQVVMDSVKIPKQKSMIQDDKSLSKISQNIILNTNIDQRKNNSHEIIEQNIHKMEPLDHKVSIVNSRLCYDNDDNNAPFDKNISTKPKLRSSHEENLSPTKNISFEEKPTSDCLPLVTKISGTSPIILPNTDKSNICHVKQHEEHIGKVHDNADVIAAPFEKNLLTNPKLEFPQKIHSQATRKNTQDEKSTSEWLNAVTENNKPRKPQIISLNESTESNRSDVKVHPECQARHNDNADLMIASLHKNIASAPSEVSLNKQENTPIKSKILDEKPTSEWLTAINENINAIASHIVPPNKSTKSDALDEKYLLSDLKSSSELKSISSQKENAPTVCIKSNDKKPTFECSQLLTENIDSDSVAGSNNVTQTRDVLNDPKTEIILDNMKQNPNVHGSPKIMLIKSNTSQGNNLIATESIEDNCTFQNSPEGKNILDHNLLILPKKHDEQPTINRDGHIVENDPVVNRVILPSIHVTIEKGENLDACNNLKNNVTEVKNIKLKNTIESRDRFLMKRNENNTKFLKNATENTSITESIPENKNIQPIVGDITNDGINSLNVTELTSDTISKNKIKNMSLTEDILDSTYIIENTPEKSVTLLFNDNVDSQMAAIHNDHISTIKIDNSPLDIKKNEQLPDSCPEINSVIKDDIQLNTLIICNDLPIPNKLPLSFKAAPSSEVCESRIKNPVIDVECEIRSSSEHETCTLSSNQHGIDAVCVTSAVISTKELMDTLSDKPLNITKDTLPILSLPPKKCFSSNLSAKTLPKLDTLQNIDGNLHNIPSNSMEVQEIISVKAITENNQEKLHMPIKFDAKKSSQSKITLIVSNELSPLTCVVFDDKESGALQMSPLCIESSQKDCSISPLGKTDTASIHSCSLESDPSSSADESLNNDSLSSKLKHPRKQILKPVIGSDTEIVFPNEIDKEPDKKVKKKRKNYIKTTLNVKKTLADSESTEKSQIKDILGDNSASSKTEENLGAFPPKKKMLARAANLTIKSVEVSHGKSAMKSIHPIGSSSEQSNTYLVNKEAESHEIKVTPKRGRPRKSHVEVDEKLTDIPTVISKTPFKKENKIEIINDDIELILSEDDTVKENWTMGKIDENIVCPICNKQFRSENVVFKHVKHCLGPPKEISPIHKRKSFMDHANSSDTLVNYHSVEEQTKITADELHISNKTENIHLNNKFTKKRKIETSHEKDTSHLLNNIKTNNLLTENNTTLHNINQPLDQATKNNTSIDQSRQDNVDEPKLAKDMTPLSRNLAPNKSTDYKSRVVKQFGSKFISNLEEKVETQVNNSVAITPDSSTQSFFEINRTSCDKKSGDIVHEQTHLDNNIYPLIQNISQKTNELKSNAVEESETDKIQNDSKLTIEGVMFQPEKEFQCTANFEPATENINMNRKSSNTITASQTINLQMPKNIQKDIDLNTVASENEIISITSQNKITKAIEIMDTPISTNTLQTTKKSALVKRKIDHNSKSNVNKKIVDTPMTRLTKILKTNPVQTNLTCEICGKSFRQLAYLVNHRAIHKSKISDGSTPEKSISAAGMFSCDVCHKNYRKLHHLVQHRQTHVREKRTFDEKANADIGRNNALENEEKVEDVIIVSEATGAEKVIIDRDNTHENELSTGGFRCEACGKSFRKLHHLVEHREIHDSPKATSAQQLFYSTKDIIHECPKCYMVFPNEPSLTRHIELCQRKKNQNKETSSTNDSKDVDLLMVNKTTEALDTINIVPIKRSSRSSCSSDRRSVVSSRSSKSKEDSKSLVNIKVDPPKVKAGPLKATVPAKVVSAKSKFVDDDLVRYKLSPSFIKASKRLSVQNVISSPSKLSKLSGRNSEFVAPKRKTMFIAGPSNAMQQISVVQHVDKNKLQSYKRTLKDGLLVTAVPKRSVQPVIARRTVAATSSTKIIPKLSPRNHPISKEKSSSKILKEKIASAAPVMNTKRISSHESVTAEMKNNDDTTIRYSFPKPAPKLRESPSNTLRLGNLPGISKESSQAIINVKGTKLQLNTLERRKSLTGITKRKSLIIKKTQSDMKAQLMKVKALKKAAADLRSHLCDCGETFSSSALLARHIRIAHTPPRGRRNTTALEGNIDNIKREKSDLTRPKIPHSGVPMSDKMKKVMSRSKIFGMSKDQ